MSLQRTFLTWGALGLVGGIVVLFSLPSYRQGEASIAGKKAEDFALELDGKPAHLSNLQGKVVVLNFWASWCPPCVEEAPALNRLQQHIASRGGTILGFSIDSDPQAYQAFLKAHSVLFPTWRDPNVKDNLSQIELKYGTSVIPETYVIDRKGKIARKIVGPQEWDSPEMLAYFDALLVEK